MNGIMFAGALAVYTLDEFAHVCDREKRTLVCLTPRLVPPRDLLDRLVPARCFQRYLRLEVPRDSPSR